ncbi:hypothetical protein ACIOEX_30290, partial [Streptomyces sp. NPDC087850]|uniref:hypothetical protein n=1 Tax=Streptomyces sp. NPDC087850 TaxID=3365809 RepID=UPI0037F1360C
ADTVPRSQYVEARTVDTTTTDSTTTATVRLQRARVWTGLFAAFGDRASATATLSALVQLEPAPRLASLDEADLVKVYRPDPALDPTALSVRAIVEESAVAEPRAIIDARRKDPGRPARAARARAGQLAVLQPPHLPPDEGRGRLVPSGGRRRCPPR